MTVETVWWDTLSGYATIFLCCHVQERRWAGWLRFDYFYGPQSDQFNFIRIPKVFFSEEEYSVISTDAAVLYGLLMDRMSLSAKNGWLDENNRVFVIYSIEEIMTRFKCANKKAGQILAELEQVGLVEKSRRGQGKTNLIYVKNFIHTVE